jgi:coenzyme F420-reducing hydrogenase delta subunit
MRRWNYKWWCKRKLRVWKKVLKRAKYERENFVDSTMEATDWNNIIKTAEEVVHIYDVWDE